MNKERRQGHLSSEGAASCLHEWPAMRAQTAKLNANGTQKLVAKQANATDNFVLEPIGRGIHRLEGSPYGKSPAPKATPTRNSTPNSRAPSTTRIAPLLSKQGDATLTTEEKIAKLERRLQDAQAGKRWAEATKICVELNAVTHLLHGGSLMGDEVAEDANCYQLSKSEWSLANCYIQQGQTTQAADHSKRALKFIRKAEENTETTSLHVAVLITLAICHTLNGKYSEAHDSLDTALELAPEHVPIHKALAKVLTAEKKRDKALKSLETALRLQEENTTAPNADPQIAEINRDIGVIFESKGNTEKAIHHFSQAHSHYSAISEEAYETAACGLQLSAVLAKSGDYSRADELLSAAEQIYEQQLGPEHPDTLAVLHERALVLIHDGQHKEALEVLQKLAVKQMKVHGFGSLELAETIRLVGTTHLALKEYSFALFTFSQAYKFFNAQLGAKAKKVKELKATITKIKHIVAGEDESAGSGSEQSADDNLSDDKLFESSGEEQSEDDQSEDEDNESGNEGSSKPNGISHGEQANGNGNAEDAYDDDFEDASDEDQD